MTWTQMKLYARVARQAKVDEYIMLTSIAHNPYRKENDARQFVQALRRERERLEHGEPERKTYNSIADFKAAFGKVNQVSIPREEFDRQKPKDLDR
jgi:hypothetical protein